MSGNSHFCITETDAWTSGCDCVRKSRLRSKPLLLVLVPAARPSGFWSVLKTTIAWSRMRSTSGSVPYGVVASLLIRSIIASTPSYSFPWIALWMKIGILKSLFFPSRFWALAGSVSASPRIFSQFWKSFCWSCVASWLIVTRYIGRPPAEWPKTWTDIRPSRLSAWMASSVHPIA